MRDMKPFCQYAIADDGTLFEVTLSMSDGEPLARLYIDGIFDSEHEDAYDARFVAQERYAETLKWRLG